MPIDNPFVGTWLYRSLLNGTDPNTSFDDLAFAVANLVITDNHGVLGGTIGAGAGTPDAWSLNLRGSFGFGSPMQVRFQGVGTGDDMPWVYDYIGWLAPPWPNSTNAQDLPVISGSIVRTIPHGAGNPAGVTATFYAVKLK
ncbi:MAG: hypothetical protein JWO56_1579 [Acidobacteria bacterium]|nr:hypothetical protein [Acidobacteriota bacterium]